jgi:hypothetical protein
MCVILPEITIGEDADEAQRVGPHHSAGAVLTLILHLGRVLKEEVRRHDTAANIDGRFSDLTLAHRDAQRLLGMKKEISEYCVFPFPLGFVPELSPS